MNKYKIVKKVGVMRNYGGSTSIVNSIVNVGLTKSYIKSCIKRVGGTRVESPKLKVESYGLRLRAVGLVIFAVAAVWAVMPANGAEAAFRKLKTLRFRRALGGLSVVLKPDLLSIVIIFA